jgi:MFS family permease
MRQVREIYHSLFRSPSAIPTVYRRNFFLLYCDVFFWGVLNGSILTFLTVYAARLGATGEQIGLIGAVPALVTLVLALPSGRWLEHQPVHGSVVWTSIASRWFYLLLVPLPFLFSEQIRIWAIIVIVLVMTIPGTATTIGFQSLFAEAVPDEWRAHVAGIRNAIFAFVSTASILICGQVLQNVKFPNGYPIVFAMGAAGALLSSVSLKLIHLEEPRILEGKGPIVQASRVKNGNSGSKMVRLDIIRGKFGLVVGLLFFFHLAQFLPIPLFPLYSVNFLKFSDEFISLGSGIFNIAVFLGSTQLEKVSKRFGNHRVVGFGILCLAFYPGLLALTRELGLYLFTNLIGGLAWSMVGGAIFNYILENVPGHDRPAHIALYTFGLNAAILLGNIIGPSIAGQIGYVEALLLFAIIRFISGLAILRWG